jgi:hypothetical protein
LLACSWAAVATSDAAAEARAHMDAKSMSKRATRVGARPARVAGLVEKKNHESVASSETNERTTTRASSASSPVFDGSVS